MNHWRREQSPMVIAHRGHSVTAPEQTMPAFAAAATLGADMVEADVRAARDGYLVLIHDETIERTTNGRGRVADLTFDELRRLDAGRWFSSDFARTPVPSLNELFDLAVRYDIGLCLEAKGATPHERALVARRVAEQIATRGRLDRDVVASFDHDALAAAARAMPGVDLAPERLPERGASSASACIAQARAIGAQIIQHHFADLSADIVSALHREGLALWAWPPRTPTEARRAVSMAVDAVMGPDVTAMAAAVRSPLRDVDIERWPRWRVHRSLRKS